MQKKMFGDMNQLEKLCKISRSIKWNISVSYVVGKPPRRPNGQAQTFLEGPQRNLQKNVSEPIFG